MVNFKAGVFEHRPKFRFLESPSVLDSPIDRGKQPLVGRDQDGRLTTGRQDPGKSLNRAIGVIEML
jgi:hypothetical protein